MEITRRSLLRSLLAAPFIVATPGLLMPVRALALPPDPLAELQIAGWENLRTLTVAVAKTGNVWRIVGPGWQPREYAVTWNAPGMSSTVSADQIAQIAQSVTP